MSELDRVRWHCRRGLLELDLILERFTRRHLETLDDGKLRQFKELLALDDNELLDLIMQRSELADARLAPVLEMLQTA